MFDAVGFPTFRQTLQFANEVFAETLENLPKAEVIHRISTAKTKGRKFNCFLHSTFSKIFKDLWI